MSDLSAAIKSVGVHSVACACGVSQRAVYKWLKRGSLPKTEFYGKTDYAIKIEKLSSGKYSASFLLMISREKLLSQD